MLDLAVVAEEGGLTVQTLELSWMRRLIDVCGTQVARRAGVSALQSLLKLLHLPDALIFVVSYFLDFQELGIVNQVDLVTFRALDEFFTNFFEHLNLIKK